MQIFLKAIRHFLQYGVGNGWLVDSGHGDFACYGHNFMGMDWTYRTNLLFGHFNTPTENFKEHFRLPPQPVITDPKLLLTPPSLRDVKNNTANMTTASAGANSTGGKNVSIVPGASTLAEKAFSPNPINVKIGGSVTWTNKDNVAHTVTSGIGPSDPNKGKEFDSGLSTLLAPGKTFSHTFKTAGEIPYFCQIHPTMVGKVAVS